MLFNYRLSFCLQRITDLTTMPSSCWKQFYRGQCQGHWRQDPLKKWRSQQDRPVLRCSDGKLYSLHTDMFDNLLLRQCLLCWRWRRFFLMSRTPGEFRCLLLWVCIPTAIIFQCPGMVRTRGRAPRFHSERWNTTISSKTPGPRSGLVDWAGPCSSKPHAWLHSHWG